MHVRRHLVVCLDGGSDGCMYHCSVSVGECLRAVSVRACVCVCVCSRIVDHHMCVCVSL